MASKSKPLPVAQQQQPVRPDQMLAKVKERIEALEDKERTEEEIERGVGEWMPCLHLWIARENSCLQAV